MVRRVTVVVRTTDRLHGRILRLEQFNTATPYWVLALRFDTIERRGAEISVNLTPGDDGERVRLTNLRPQGSTAARTLIIPPPRPPGGAVYTFSERGELVLDRGFRTSWETR